MAEHPTPLQWNTAEKADTPTAISAVDFLNALECGLRLQSRACQDCIDDLNRGWNFAIANSIMLFYGFYALGGITPIRGTPWLRSVALLPPMLGALSFYTATAFRLRSAIVTRKGSSAKFLQDITQLRRQHICFLLGPEMLLIGLALLPILAEIMTLIWFPYFNPQPTLDISAWTEMEHFFLGCAAGAAFFYCVCMFWIVIRLGRDNRDDQSQTTDIPEK